MVPGVRPEGKIAFLSIPGPTRGSEDLYYLHVINADGTGLTRLHDHATGPVWSPDGSLIAFTLVVEPSSLFELAVVRPDGSGLTRLAGDAAGYVWSPDGRRIAFTRQASPGSFNLFLVNADGSGLENVSQSGASDSDPAWSPDGIRIAFFSVLPSASQTIDYRLAIIDADGSNYATIDQDATYLGTRPVWSPDGSHIVFAAPSYEAEAESRIVSADGSSATRLGTGVRDPVWSPDGKRLAFATVRDAVEESRNAVYDLGAEVYVANADGSGLVNLSRSRALDWNPSWSPDGRKVLFASTRDGNAEVYVIDADGSGLTNLTKDPGHDFCPAWSPDGSWIAFVSRRDGNREIYLMRADGSAQLRLTNSSAEDFAPSWQPASTGRRVGLGSSQRRSCAGVGP